MADSADQYLVIDENGNGRLKVKKAPGGEYDRGLCGGAWAALNSSFRGNPYDGPDKAKALSKLKGIYKSQGWELPTTAAELPSTSGVLVYGRSDDGGYIFDEPLEGAEPTVDDLHIPVPLGSGKKKRRNPAFRKLLQKMRELAGGKGYVTAEEVEAAQAAARGHAGGVARHQKAAVPPGTPPDDPKGPPQGWQICPSCSVGDYDACTCPACEAGDDEDCYCQAVLDAMAQPGTGPKDKPAMSQAISPLMATGNDLQQRAFSLFLASIREEADPPEWINVLPRPGTYKHPEYGDVKVTQESNATAVANFKAAVYQPTLPLDVEHDLKLSGAAANMVDLRQNSDGSCDARLEWTPRGAAIYRGGGFRYISPEWFDEWTDSLTGKVHKHVLIGAAMCRRPFFKPPNLLPLVASEDGTYSVPETNPSIGGTQMPTTITPGQGNQPAPAGPTLPELESKLAAETAVAKDFGEKAQAAHTASEDATKDETARQMAELRFIAYTGQREAAEARASVLKGQVDEAKAKLAATPLVTIPATFTAESLAGIDPNVAHVLLAQQEQIKAYHEREQASQQRLVHLEEQERRQTFKEKYRSFTQGDEELDRRVEFAMQLPTDALREKMVEEWKAVDGAKKQAMAVLGQTNGILGDPNQQAGVMPQVRAMAEEVMKRPRGEGATSISLEMAEAQVLKEHPELYDQYLQEHPILSAGGPQA